MINIKFLDNEQREQIGFLFILDKLEVITPYGVEEKKNIKPFKRDELYKLYNELNVLDIIYKNLEVNKVIYSDIERIFCRIKDIRSSIKRCESLDSLDDVELYEIKYFALLINEFLSAFERLNLNITDFKFCSLEDLVDVLDPEGKRIPTFHIYDNYSKKLKKIREEKEKLEGKIVVEKDKLKLKILKEERLNIVVLEEEEELVIRKKLTKEIKNYCYMLRNNIRNIGKLDFLLAKAKLALRYKGIKPEISDKMKIMLEGVFNPMISEILESKGKSFTALNIKLVGGTTIITGANMGGKSVALKTTVLNLLLAQYGFFVFAKYAVIPALDFIHFISDDMQSISKGLSTFGAEILKLKDVIEDAKKKKGFIALDEFARGTNPKEGYYLVKSVSKYLSNFDSVSLISTHYDGIADEDMEHYQVIGLKNIDFNSLKYKIDLNKKYSVEIIQDHMEYSLERVSKESKVPKDALNICVLLGLEDEVIEITKKYYKDDYKMK